MARTLAEFAASAAPLPERLRVARGLALAAEALGARGRAHGALAPETVLVQDGGEVVVLAPAPAGRLARAGFEAPEVARGGPASTRADAFSVGSLAWLALAGRGPFEAGAPLETLRRVLHEEPAPVRLHARGVPLAVDAAIAALLEKRPARRGPVGALAEAVGAANAAAPPLPGPLPLALPGGSPTSTSTSTSTSTPTPTPTPTPTSTPTSTSIATPAPARAARAAAAAAAGARALVGALARGVRATADLPPLARTVLAALPAVAIALAVLPGGDAALARQVTALLEAGDVPEARARVEAAAARRPGSPVVEKLRGDVACARGAPGECLRRYRVAIAARDELRRDPALRANARRLLARGQSCGTRRAAAQLLGELRDPEALPALEEARRSGGLFAAFCTGDAFDRAIQATRADVP